MEDLKFGTLTSRSDLLSDLMMALSTLFQSLLTVNILPPEEETNLFIFGMSLILKNLSEPLKPDLSSTQSNSTLNYNGSMLLSIQASKSGTWPKMEKNLLLI